MASSASQFLGIQKPTGQTSAFDFLGVSDPSIIKGSRRASSQDYSDLPIEHRVVLAAMDNEAEKRAYLEKAFGKGSVSKDKKGLIVTADGKKMRASTGFMASMIADAPEIGLGILGASEGGAVGTALGPIGTLIGAVTGAATGALTGKSVKEAIKSATGLQRKSSAAIGGSIGSAGESGMYAELTGRAVGPLVSRLSRGPLPRSFTSTTPETEKMTERLISKGARPHPQSTMPTARHIQREAIIADKVSGPSKSINRANIGYLQGQMEVILGKAKVPINLRDDVMRRLQGASDSAISFQEVGKRIQNTSKFMLSQKLAPKDKAYLKIISQTTRTPEDAYLWLTAPQETDRLERFVRVMGKNSQVVQEVQFQALRNVLSGAMIRSATGEATEALQKEIGSFTDRQQELLFPDGLSDNIKLVAKEIQFLYPKIKDPAMAGFKAGNILGFIWYNRWWAQAMHSLYRGLLQQPVVIRRLAVGFKGTSPQRIAARNALQAMIYFGALEMNLPSSQQTTQASP